MGVVTPEFSSNSPSSSSFNSDTSHGQCGPDHFGLIAKGKVGAGAELLAKDLDNPEKLPLPLLSLAITISWCGERLAKWPSAKDAKVGLGLRDDLDRAVQKYGAVKVIKAVDLVSGSLLVWEPRIVSEQLDVLRPEAERIRSASMSSSPLFAEFHKQFPHIDSELFDQCYEQHGGKFVESAIYLLKMKFKFIPPPDLEHIEGWQQRWQQYLPHYLKQWQNELKSMETRMRIAQNAWKASMS